MAKILKENEVRVNKTCVSISKNLYEKIIKDNTKEVYAKISFYKVGGDINIRFSSNHFPDSVMVNTFTSKNQVSLDDTYLYENKEGTYKCHIDNTNSIRGKKFKKSKDKV